MHKDQLGSRCSVGVGTGTRPAQKLAPTGRQPHKAKQARVFEVRNEHQVPVPNSGLFIEAIIRFLRPFSLNIDNRDTKKPAVHPQRSQSIGRVPRDSKDVNIV